MENDYKFCLRCNRRLKNPEYKVRGYGKICWEKMQTEKKVKPLFERTTHADDKP